ncbi:MAG: M1 family aminopeptidase [Actinomycetota bacterium]
MSDESRYRLPRSVVPRRYDLVLEPDLEAATFCGSEDVQVEVRESVGEVVLNAEGLEISSGWLTRGDTRIDVVGVRLDDGTGRAHVGLAGEAAPGEWVLHLEFSGHLSDRMRGFYRSTYQSDDGRTRTIATTQFESTDARRAFPCWDEPDLKAVFGVTLVVGEDDLAISNGPEVERGPKGDGRIRVRFADTMPMSTYLAAFVVGPMEATAPVDVDGVPLRIVHQPGKGHLASYGLEVGAFCLRFFSEYYGIPYPDAKVDLVALPDFAQGAMENLGCITFRENLLLADPAKATQPELAAVADVIAHELAHMWFGDLVTMRWWNGTWLNEAFATFMEILSVDAFRPDWERWTQFLRTRSQAFEVDALHSTRSIEYPVASPDDAAGMFDTLTYTKGAAVLRMLEQYLGAERFRDGIRKYLADHRFGNTETHHLWEAIESATGEPVRRIMDGWIWQGGYPMVTAELDGDRVRLSQHRFLLSGDQGDGAWDVPLLIRSEGRTWPLLVAAGGASVPAPAGGPVVVNAGAHAFTRVRYGQELLERIASSLGELSTDERTQLVDDAWAAVVSGRSSASDFCRFAGAYGDETELTVWSALLQGLGWCDRFLDAAPREHFRAWLRGLATPALERIGWEPRDDEADLTRSLRGMLLSALAILGGEPNAQALAREIEGEARAGAGVDPSLAAASVSIVAAGGGPEEFEAFLEARMSAPTPQEQLRYLYALPEFRDAMLIDRTVELALGEGVRPQNAPWLFSRAIANRDQGERAWRFVKEHWDEIVARCAPSTMVFVVEGVRALTTPELVQDAETFFADHPIPQSALQLRQILERQRVNAELRRRAVPDLQSFFSAASA